MIKSEFQLDHNNSWSASLPETGLETGLGVELIVELNWEQDGAAEVRAEEEATGLVTLAIDVGGTGLKAALLDEQGRMVSERVRVKTPRPCPPELLVTMVQELVAALAEYDRVSVGFPGVVRRGCILTAVLS